MSELKMTMQEDIRVYGSDVLSEAPTEGLEVSEQTSEASEEPEAPEAPDDIRVFGSDGLAEEPTEAPEAPEAPEVSTQTSEAPEAPEVRSEQTPKIVEAPLKVPESRSTQNAPRRSYLMKKQKSAPNLMSRDEAAFPNASVWAFVQAAHKLKLDDSQSIYSEIVPKEAREFVYDVPQTLTVDTTKRVGTSLTTGGQNERVSNVDQILPASMAVSAEEASGGYSQSISKAEVDRIREVLHRYMDDDAISVITSSIQSQKKKTKKKRISRKLEKARSLPDLLVDEAAKFNRSVGDLTLASKQDEPKKRLKKSGSDRSLTSKKSLRRKSISDRSPSSKRSSSKTKLRKPKSSERSPGAKKSSRKGLKKSNSTPNLSSGEKKKKSKRSSLKKSSSTSSLMDPESMDGEKMPRRSSLKKSGSERSLSKGARKRRSKKPRSKSTSMLDMDPAFAADAAAAEIAALKAEFEETLRQAKAEIGAGGGAPQRKSGAHEEERIRVFAEAQRRSQSLSPTKYKIDDVDGNLGNLDGHRYVVDEDRRFSKSWSKVLATPPKTKLRRSLSRGRLPAISAL